MVMNIVVVSGSHRKESQSDKVASFCARSLMDSDAGVRAKVISLANNPLPLWSEEKWQAGSELQKLWEPYKVALEHADGLVVVSPEWAGMVPPGLKNFFMFCDGGEVAHKPAMLVGVSASRGGSYPIAELRMSSYKNNFLCYIPDHVIVREVNDVLNGFNEEGEYTAERLKYSLNLLVSYSKALRSVRESGLIDREKYPYGM
jgi:NAD(P)H-dependent FMN reductase